MNILILSAGTRNKIIQYFKKAVGNDGKVVATDMQITAPAIFEADKYYIVPRITEPGYIDLILDICKKEEINGVLSLIDPELSLLAANEEQFKVAGVTVIGSSYGLCEMAYNKMKMHNWLEAHGYNCAKSYANKDAFYSALNAGQIDFPVFVKPVCGSASIAVNRVEDKDTLDFLWAHGENLMIQECLEGQEIGADVYIDMLSHKVVSVFTKKKILMRDGETNKAVSFKDEKLFDLIERFVKECGWNGQIDIDIFEIGGNYYITEVNPRFGGGYPHAYECGCNHMDMIINNLSGISNIRDIGAYEDDICMMKYNEVCVKRL